MNARGVINVGDKLAEVEGGSEVSEVVDEGGSIGDDEENTGGVAVDLDTTIVVPLQAASHGVERDQGLGEGLLHHPRVEEIGGAGGSVEVDARSVEPRDDQVNVRVPQVSGGGLGGGPDHGGITDVNFHC